MRRLLLAVAACLPIAAAAQDHSAAIDAALDTHVLPGFERLETTAVTLAEATRNDCRATSERLRAAYHDAFDAWVAVSHLRFGPSETDNRAFALAFWPDSRGATPRSLGQMIASEDPAGLSVESFRDVSVAARGFYALEFLLYDEAISTSEPAGYRCTLVQTVTADIAATSAAIRNDWTNTHATLLRSPALDQRYQTDTEAMRALFNALTTGLEFTADVRLGRPLGTFERPRPRRAEARRSGRSLHHVSLSLAALEELALALAADAPETQDRLAIAFDDAQATAERLDDPILAAVADPSGRFRVEVLQQRVRELRDLALTEMGPALGVSAGFNALDGD